MPYLMDHGPADLLGYLPLGLAQGANRLAVDGDDIGRHQGVLGAPAGQGDAFVKPEHAARPAVMVDHQGDVAQQPPELLGQPVQSVLDHLLEVRRLDLHHPSIVRCKDGPMTRGTT
jgi:hypothetical protein